MDLDLKNWCLLRYEVTFQIFREYCVQFVDRLSLPIFSMPTRAAAATVMLCKFVILIFNSELVSVVSAGDTVDGSTRRTAVQLAKYLNIILEHLRNF